MANGASSAYLLSLLRSQGGYADAAARSLLGRDVTTERQLLAEKNREIEKAIRDRERAAKKKRRRRGRASALASIAGYALGGAGGAALGSLLGSRLSRARQGDIKSIGTEIGEGKFLKGDREDLVNFLEDANYQISQQNKKGLGWQEDLMTAAQAYGTGKAFGGTEFGQKMGTFRGWDLGKKIQQSKMMTSGLGGKLKNWWSGPNVTPQSNYQIDIPDYAAQFRASLSPFEQAKLSSQLNAPLFNYQPGASLIGKGKMGVKGHLSNLFKTNSDLLPQLQLPIWGNY
tara:strand:+ start:224 stop:1081 length:858 start_codon:yes stop_codon:yes gene_type:complete